MENSRFDSRLFFYILKSIFFESSYDRGPQEPQKMQILGLLVCLFLSVLEALISFSITS